MFSCSRFNTKAVLYSQKALRSLPDQSVGGSLILGGLLMCAVIIFQVQNASIASTGISSPLHISMFSCSFRSQRCAFISLPPKPCPVFDATDCLFSVFSNIVCDIIVHLFKSQIDGNHSDVTSVHLQVVRAFILMLHNELRRWRHDPRRLSTETLRHGVGVLRLLASQVCKGISVFRPGVTAHAI